MKIFLTGGTGLLGRAFVDLMTERGLDFVAPTSDVLDLLDFETVNHFIATKKPDLILHCAAYTAVDQAETERKKCWDLNVEVLRNLLKSGCPIVHFSTDYVFDTDLRPIPVDQEREPLNYYGETKATAEELLESYQGDWYNIRTTWLYGPNGKGFPEKVKQRAASSEQLTVVDDQFGRKTLSTDLAVFVLNQLASPEGMEPGHHHYQSPGPVHSWYEWACELVGDENVIPINTASLNLPAQRPRNSVLV